MSSPMGGLPWPFVDPLHYQEFLNVVSQLLEHSGGKSGIG